MHPVLKNIIQFPLKLIGYRLAYSPKDTVNSFLIEEDINVLIRKDQPVCFDVGANKGQTIEWMQSCLKNCRVYAFEPSTDTFKALQTKAYSPAVSLNNCALGDKISQLEFTNYEDSVLSSLLVLDSNQTGRFKNTRIRSKEIVPVKTVDWFMNEHHIGEIDLLKIDTQGYDLAVLRGAETAFRDGRIKNVYVEINFVKLYQNQCDAQLVIDFLQQRNMRLVDYYDKMRSHSTIEWCNALFTRVDP
jgi:FkbM family methyltransferase